MGLKNMIFNNIRFSKYKKHNLIVNNKSSNKPKKKLSKRSKYSEVEQKYLKKLKKCAKKKR